MEPSTIVKRTLYWVNNFTESISNLLLLCLKKFLKKFKGIIFGEAQQNHFVWDYELLC